MAQSKRIMKLKRQILSAIYSREEVEIHTSTKHHITPAQMAVERRYGEPVRTSCQVNRQDNTPALPSRREEQLTVIKILLIFP